MLIEVSAPRATLLLEMVVTFFIVNNQLVIIYMVTGYCSYVGFTLIINTTVITKIYYNSYLLLLLLYALLFLYIMVITVYFHIVLNCRCNCN